MAADISLAAPQPPRLSARPKIGFGAVVAILAMTMLIFSSFGIVADLFIVIGARAVGASPDVAWSAGAAGAVAMLVLSFWNACSVWREQQAKAASEA